MPQSLFSLPKERSRISQLEEFTGTKEENQLSFPFRQIFFHTPQFLFFLFTAKWFKIFSGFLCSFQGFRGTSLKKNCLHLPAYFQDGCHQYLKLIWTRSPDCFDRFSSNFVQSLIFLTRGTLLILYKIAKNMAASGNFVNCDFTGAMLNIRRLSPNVSLGPRWPSG